MRFLENATSTHFSLMEGCSLGHRINLKDWFEFRIFNLSLFCFVYSVTFARVRACIVDAEKTVQLDATKFDRSEFGSQAFVNGMVSVMLASI